MDGTTWQSYFCELKMHNSKYITLACCVLISLTGCGGPSMSDYFKTVQDGISSVDQSEDLENLFPHTDHFITHYNMNGKQWLNSEVYLNGGYTITIQALIDIDYSENKVTVLSSPQIYLNIIEDIERLPNGSFSASINQPDVEVTDELWEKFVESEGDITLLGFDPSRANPTYWNEYVAAWQRDRLEYKQPDDSE